MQEIEQYFSHFNSQQTQFFRCRLNDSFLRQNYSVFRQFFSISDKNAPLRRKSPKKWTRKNGTWKMWSLSRIAEICPLAEWSRSTVLTPLCIFLSPEVRQLNAEMGGRKSRPLHPPHRLLHPFHLPPAVLQHRPHHLWVSNFPVNGPFVPSWSGWESCSRWFVPCILDM